MKLYTYILFFLLSLSICVGQYDTEFWFAVPPIVPKYSTILYKPVFLRLMTKDKSSEITISIPADPSFKPIIVSLDANSLSNVDLTPFIDQLENRITNTILNKGLNIRSTESIIAIYDLVSSPADAEFWSLKGKIGLGEYFVVPGQNSYDNNSSYTPILPKNTVIIVASEDSTDIFVTPSNNAIGHVANIKFKIILNKGQTYCLESESQLASKNLTGTVVESTKPIAITMSDDLLTVGSCQDAIGDQILPFKSLGNEYAIVPGNLDTEMLLIISTEQNNEILIDDLKVKVMNRNEVYYHNFSENTYIKSKYPIYVFHFTGVGCEISATTILPFTCSGIKEVYYNFDKVEFGNNNAIQYLIVVPAEGVDQFYINGNQKITGIFKPFPSKADIVGGIISINNYEYNKQLTLSNKVSTFSVGFLVGGNTVPGAKYVYLNDIQNDNRIEFKIKLPEIYLTNSDSIVNLPIYLEAKSDKFPIILNDLSISFETDDALLKALDLNNGTFTESKFNNKYEIKCNFPFIKLKNQLTLIDTIFCKIIKADKKNHNIAVTSNSLTKNPCNTVQSNIGILNFTCGTSSFTYDGFFDVKDLKFSGVAHQNTDYIRLTNSRINEVGSIIYKIPVSLTNSFSSSFRFRLLSGTNNNCYDNSLPGADGLALLIYNTSIDEFGYNGGGIGYENLRNCFAIEYDTFSNDSNQIENYYDPNGNHIAIQKSENKEYISSKHTQAFNLALNDKILKLKSDGTIYYSTVDYNSKDKTLKIFLDSIETFSTPVLEMSNFNFSDYINLINNEFAYLGISSATGCAFEIHDILYWDFCSAKNSVFNDIVENINYLDITSSTGRDVYFNEAFVLNGKLIELFNIYGQKTVDQFQIITDNHLILSENLSNGVYFLTINLGQKKLIKKILIY